MAAAPFGRDSRDTFSGGPHDAGDGPRKFGPDYASANDRDPHQVDYPPKREARESVLPKRSWGDERFGEGPIETPLPAP